MSEFIHLRLDSKQEHSSQDSLVDLEELDLEDERGVRRDNARSALGAVGVLRRDCEPGQLADLHRCDTEAPALDHALADRERERLPAVAARVELLAVREGSDVVDVDLLATLRLRAGTLAEDLLRDFAVAGHVDRSGHL